MRNEVEERARFVSFCIEQYAKAKNMATENVVYREVIDRHKIC